MTQHIIYYSTVFIIALALIGQMIGRNSLAIGEIDDERKHFIYYCGLFIIWSICIVIVGVFKSDVSNRVFLLLGEGFRMTALVAGSEILGVITGVSQIKKKTLFTISSELLYFGVVTLSVNLFLNRADIIDGVFGKYFEKGINIGLFMYIFFHFIVLFFYAAYTYLFSRTCSKRREYYILKQCLAIVVVLAICICTESFFYLRYGEYVPATYLGMFISILVFAHIIGYKKSIRLDENYYQRILAPSYNKPSFVCDDEGRIVFENTKAYIMQQTYKDVYTGRLLTDIFELSEADRERFREAKDNNSYEICCKYKGHSLDFLLLVKHNLDKYGSVLSTEIELEPLSQNQTVKKPAEMEMEEEKKETSFDTELSANDVSKVRTEQLLKQLENQKAFFEKKNESLFGINLNGIKKSAAVLDLPALVELCDRIQTDKAEGDWNMLESLVIELDRQYETLKNTQKNNREGD